MHSVLIPPTFLRRNDAWWSAISEEAHAVARKLTRDELFAEDLAQEGIVLLLEWPGQVHHTRGWFAVVLRRLAAKMRRVDLRDRELAAVSVALDTGQPSPELRVDLRDAVALLAPRQQTILGLALQGYSHAELAGQLGCKVNQVGPRLARARRALEKNLQAEV